MDGRTFKNFDEAIGAFDLDSDCCVDLASHESAGYYVTGAESDLGTGIYRVNKS
jgi:hypothetical protein